MKILGALLAGILAIISGLHAYWGFGGLWPAASERELIDTVIGLGQLQSMPPLLPTLVIAAALMGAGVVALFASGIVSVGPRWLARLAGAAAALAFLWRGVAGYYFDQWAWEPVEPFASLNLWFYSPLCLVIGAGFAVLAMSRSQQKEGS